MSTAAPLARLQPRPAPRAVERRREPRVTAHREASMRDSRGAEASVTLVDASLHGCCVTGFAASLRSGSFVTVALAGEDGLTAVVRWLREGIAGMEFLRPIPADRHAWHDLIDSPFA